MSIHADVPARLPIPWERIKAFCRKWGIAELALFGSVLRDDFGPDSDVDVLVRYKPGVPRTLFDLVEKEEELAAIFGHRVDLLSRSGVEQSENPFRKNAILGSAHVIYAES